MVPVCPFRNIRASFHAGLVPNWLDAMFFVLCNGEMTEWLKVRAWKVRIPQKGIVGSNPAFSADIRPALPGGDGGVCWKFLGRGRSVDSGGAGGAAGRCFLF